MLNVYQFKAVHKFIKLFLTFEIQFTHDLMFDAIKILNCALNSEYRNLCLVIE